LLPVFRLQSRCNNATLPYEPASLRQILLKSPGLRVFGVVNALWEFSFAGLKSFIVLYVVRGLGLSAAVASAVIAVVAVADIVGAPLAGWLADRYGLVRVLRLASLVYGAREPPITVSDEGVTSRSRSTDLLTTDGRASQAPRVRATEIRPNAAANWQVRASCAPVGNRAGR
jgi:MFS_1 like family